MFFFPPPKFLTTFHKNHLKKKKKPETCKTNFSLFAYNILFMMQDPISSFHSIEDNNLQQQQQQQIKCPRCESTNTKFCYYNNYNLSQPRHFCKNCRRYWTKGGTLRNIPVGGGSRKNSKRPSSSDSSSSSSNSKRAKDQKPELEPVSAAAYPNPTAEDKMMEISGTFSSLLQSNGQFGNLLDGFGSDANPDPVADPNPQQQGESLLGWVGGWPDLAIYTSPGSSFQ